MATNQEVLTHITSTRSTFNNIVKSEGTLPEGVDNLDNLEAQYARGAGSLWNSNNTYKSGDIVSSDDLEIYVSNLVLDADNNEIENIGKALDTEFWTKIESMNTTTKKGFIEPVGVCNFVIDFDNSGAPEFINKTAKILSIVRLDQFNIQVNIENQGSLDYAIFTSNYETSGTNYRYIYTAVKDKTLSSFVLGIWGTGDHESSHPSKFSFNVEIYNGGN